MNLGRPGKDLLVCFLILGVAAALRIKGLDWGLPQIYEEATPLKKAWYMWGWGSFYSFDLNPHFFKYPSLTIYLQFLGQGLLYLLLWGAGTISSSGDFRALYVSDPTAFMLMGRSITLVLALGSVGMTFLLGRRVGGWMVGGGAAFLLAVNTLHISKSQVIEVDVPLTCFVLLTLWMAARWWDSPTRGNLVGAGAALGLAVSVKYTGAFLLVPLLAVIFMATRLRRDPGERGVLGDTLRNAVVPVLVVGGTGLLVFFLTSPYVFLDFPSFWRDLAMEREHMRMGHFGGANLSTPQFYVLSLGNRLLGWPVLVLGGIGMIYYAAVRRDPWALPFVLFIVFYLGIVATWSMKADRYLLPLLPLVMIIAFKLLRDLVDRWITERRRFLRMTVLVLVTVGFSLIPFSGYSRLISIRNLDPRTQALEWVEQRVPTGAYILSENLGPEFLNTKKLWSLDKRLRGHLVARTQRPIFATQVIPMYQVAPERAGFFYDLALYDMVDLFILTGSVSSRYLKEPDRFPHQMAFYDRLNQEFEKVAEFRREGAARAEITIYKRPGDLPPFSRRPDLPGPRAVDLSGFKASEQAVFYYNMGLNYEAFGFFEPALECYRLALQYPLGRGQLYGLIAGSTRCFMQLNQGDRALPLIDWAIGVTPEDEDRRNLRRLRSQIFPGAG